jgi:hypothetical protein
MVTEQIEIVKSVALQFYKLLQREKSVWNVNKDHVSRQEIIGG